MGLSAAVQWWEEWQLRILVLSSLTVQRLLLLSALWRRRAIPWWFRSLIWLAYLGSDALAIYSLAALFNRRRKQEDWANAASSRALEALWVPILLMHLGGQDGITAYNIEDNELWRRHVLTAVSQVTVAIYVFCKSWPGGDNNLLKAAVLLFINGVLKCLEKPLALKNASINSLVSSSEPARRTAKREGEINPVEKYVREAKNIIVLSSVQHKSQDEEQEGGNLAQDTHHHPSNEKRHAVAVHREQYEPQEERGESTSQDNGCPPPQEEGDAAYDKSSWPGMVPQYSLAGFFVRNKRHAKKMRTVSLFGCKDYLDQHWCMKSCSSSYRITVLVLQYLKAGWRDYVQDAATYMMFNDHRGQWTLNRNKCNHHVWSLNCPFDESVLLWHIATELCFFWSAFPGYRFAFSEVKSTWQILLKGVENDRRTNFQCGELTCCKAVQCRQMSNYMVYLLFVNPEMLLPGSRRNLFTTAYGELKRILEDKKPEPTWWRAGIRQRNKPPVEEKELTEEGFIHDAWTLTQELLALGDEDKMWEVIEGVWVEMLCFSAGRCRGYLHAKALGTGGELLTYVWLLMSYMGMETLAERMQRTELPSGAGNDGAAPSTSGLPNGPAAASGPEVRTDTAPSTSRFPSGAGSSASTEVPTATGAAPSTSEIRMADGEDMV